MAKDDELDLENLDPAEPENFRRLREYAERQKKAADGAEGLKRENAFLRAGIDLSTRKGAAFARIYEGKLDDVDAILADAKDFDPSIVKVAPAAGEPPEAGTAGTPAPVAQGQGTPQQPQATGTSERQALADGAAPGSTGEDPKGDSINRAKEKLGKGMTWERAAGEFVHERAVAVAEGKLPALDAQGRPYHPNS